MNLIPCLQRFVEDLKLSCNRRPQLVDLLNNKGFTPLTLAAHKGKRSIVETLLAHRSKAMWNWGNVRVSLLSLDQIDDIPQVWSRRVNPRVRSNYIDLIAHD
jgi:hypothetical protein